MPCLAWVMLAIEEHSVHDAELFRHSAENLEPSFLAVHLEHGKDEARHVSIDIDLLCELHANLSVSLRRANAHAFAWMMRTYLCAPGDACARVLTQLAREFPDLLPLRTGMLKDVRGLNQHPAHQRMMYSRESTPRLFALFDRIPGFSMGSILPTYRPAAAEATR
jgi:hypothetical protein